MRVARRIRPLTAMALLGAACLLLGGCLFSPREPEPPTTGTPVSYLPRTSPINVWTNLERSLEATHAPGWEDAISLSNFLYFPDDDARRQFPEGTFLGWNQTDEQAFINNFYNSGVTIEAQMINDDFDPPEAGAVVTVWENVIYDLIVTSQIDGSVTRYRASAIITFTLENNFVYITRWDDQERESDPDNPGSLLSSMGVLRGTFGSK